MVDFIDVNQFIVGSNLKKQSGLLRTNRFRVTVTLPTFVLKRSSTTNAEIAFNALAVSCPGIELEVGSQDINTWQQYYYKGRKDNEIKISFLESADLSIRTVFNDWISLGYNNNTRVRRYFEEIASPSIRVIPINNSGGWDRCDQFREVIPFSIGEIQYDTNDMDMIIRTEVSFKYRFHDIISAT